MKYMAKFAEVKIPKTYEIDELLILVKEADAILTWSKTRLSREVLSHASEKLKTIAVTGIGYDNIDVKAANDKGIIITNTPGANSTAVAEYTIGMILTSIKHCFKGALLCKNKGWDEGDRFSGRELKGSTVGIVALGNAGRNVASLLSSFNCKIIGYDPFIDTQKRGELADKYNVEIVMTLEELSKRANVVSLHVPLTDSTFHMLNKQHFELMQQDTWIINAGRAAVVDEDSLYEYLRDNKIGGYCTDVFPVEPPDFDKPLYSLDNVIATPHMAAMTFSSHEEMQLRAAENVWAVFNNEKPLNVIEK
jgi:D-3-phosphoglycerate dehydrogenase